ncbi:TetR/AcrR family transcriptional regulator, partial [Klebsiella pneumoniae]|uniref:TetR/AcrR family transcriptional regulator n=1 Tax=Klebsiella pneumoniae TaxID=573 RepID=UPI0015F838AB
MARKARTELIEETRRKLVAAARQQFGGVGYAETVMDELTAQAGMTRGALYHHFGDTKGLFLAVVQEIDAEMDA